MKGSIGIIPKPNYVVQQEGRFLLKADHTIFAHPQAVEAAVFLEGHTGLRRSSSGGVVRLYHDRSMADPEAYSLTVDSRGVEIRAGGSAGFYYGVQSLRQLLPPESEKGKLDGETSLPFIEIQDAPRFEYRGFMLDVSRHFFTVDEIKRTLDLLALHKINRFHWHLSDDQGWRVEIKSRPRLTERGSCRPRSQVGGWILSRPVFDETPHCGYYSQEDIREVVEYAARNFIEVIPEIDVPGHSAAAIAAYPELSCRADASEVRAEFTSFSVPLCVGNEEVFAFLDDVFTELSELFPFGHIHMGGDEVRKKEWKNCPRCQERVRNEGLGSHKQLQSYFQNRLVTMLKEKGLKVIGWGDILEDGLDPSVINQYWLFNRKRATIAHLRQGRPTVISDFGSLYLDYSYRVMDLTRTYEFEPQLPDVDDAAATNILGVEAPLWSEYVYSRNRQDWQMFPRLCAVSEIAWTRKDRRDYDDFLDRLSDFERRLDALGVHHATRECYLRRRVGAKLPTLLKILFSRQHPAMAEYRKFHPSEPDRTKAIGGEA